MIADDIKSRLQKPVAFSIAALIVFVPLLVYAGAIAAFIAVVALAVFLGPALSRNLVPLAIIMAVFTLSNRLIDVNLVDRTITPKQAAEQVAAAEKKAAAATLAAERARVATEEKNKAIAAREQAIAAKEAVVKQNEANAALAKQYTPVRKPAAAELYGVVWLMKAQQKYAAPIWRNGYRTTADVYVGCNGTPTPDYVTYYAGYINNKQQYYSVEESDREYYAQICRAVR